MSASDTERLTCEFVAKGDHYACPEAGGGRGSPLSDWCRPCLRARLAEVEAERDGLIQNAKAAWDDATRLERELAEAREALAWYAEWRNYRAPAGEPDEHNEAECAIFQRDSWLGGQPGSRARAVLTSPDPQQTNNQNEGISQRTTGGPADQKPPRFASPDPQETP